MIHGAVVCDSQVHAPDRPSSVHVRGIDPRDLLQQMDEAGVDRCVLVPLAAPLPDVSTNNGASLEAARGDPDRFAVMGRFDLTNPANAKLLPSWKDDPAMLGIRLSFARGADRELLEKEALEWFWAAAEASDIPLMLLAPENLPAVGQVARAHPKLRLIVDHLGLTPYVVYDDPMSALPPLLALARYDNVAVKASALPDSVPDPYPFRSLHDPLRVVVETFGHRRVFWGSDLTRLKCTYPEVVDLFAHELRFLSAEAREWVLGRGIMEWIGWTTAGPAGKVV